MMRILVLDNYDSFVYNLYQKIIVLTGSFPDVIRNDRITVAEIHHYRPDFIVISPGPGNPENPSSFGICRDVILEFGPSVPLLGVCLGHQGIGAAFGGRVTRAPRPRHGKTSLIHHDGQDIFQDLPRPFQAMRYHSLALDPDTLPADLLITARSDDGVVMGVRHRRFPVRGVQFHPESVGTPWGVAILANFFGISPLARVAALVREAEAEWGDRPPER